MKITTRDNMIYLDEIWCKHKDCIKYSDCKRALTEKIINKALKFGVNTFTIIINPECYEVKK